MNRPSSLFNLGERLGELEFPGKWAKIIPSLFGGAGRAEEKNSRSPVPGSQYSHGFLTFFANQRVQEASEGIPDDLQVPFQLPVS